MKKKISIEDIILRTCLISLFILMSFIFYTFVTFDYESIPQTEIVEREPFRHETKNIELFVKDVVRVRNSNVFKEDKYYVETNGVNSYNKLYISKEIYDYLVDNLKEPSIVNFECKVMNGYMDGTTYNDYVIEILNISK